LNVLSFGHEEDDSSSIHIHNERKSLFEAQKPSTARRDSLKEEIDDTLLHVYNEEENCVICDVDEEEQKNIAHGSAEPEFKADGNEEAQVDDTIPTHQRFLEPHSQGNNTRNTDEQSSRHPKKSIVEERREKYKRLQKTAVDKKGKRQREENTIQRLLDFKSKLATEANQKDLNDVTEDQNLSENEAIGKEKVLLDFLTADDYVVIDSSLEANRKVRG